MKRLFFRAFIGAERHIDDNKRMLRAAHHGAALQNHHLECDRHRGLEPVHNVAEGIADQDDVAVAVDQRRRVRVIRGQHHDGIAALAGANLRRGFALDGRLHRHLQAPTTGTPITTGWNAKASAR
jgi:hypothetical protein